jgi:hypothetical protein
MQLEIEEGKTLSYVERRQQLEAKFELLVEKAKLHKKPKLKIDNGFAPASYKETYNTVYFSKRTVEEWVEGTITEREIDYSLVHELGHAISYTRQKDHYATLLTLYFMGAFITVLLAAIANQCSLNMFDRAISGVIVLLTVILWLIFLPWVLRCLQVPKELLANRCAVEYGLMSAEDMALIIVSRTPIVEKVGPFKLIKILHSFIIHPYLGENLQNLGYRLRNGKLEKIG